MISVEALARSAGGNARNSIASPTGVNIPPPTPLDDTERDQLPDGLRRAAQHRAGREGHQREQEGSLGAEAVAEPAGGRDPHGQAERVAEHDPLGVLGVQLATECRNGDVDDGRVEDVEEQRRHVHDGDDPLVGDLPTEHLHRVIGGSGKSCHLIRG